MRNRTARDGPAKDLADGNHYRSTWERNMARLMGRLGIEAAYEPKRFYFRDIHESYLPDWRLKNVGPLTLDGNTYHEIYIELKGYLDNKSKRQLRNIRRYYAKKGVMVILIDSEQYKKLEQDYSGNIGAWEYERISTQERSDKPDECTGASSRGGGAETQEHGPELQQDRGEDRGHLKGRRKKSTGEGTGEIENRDSGKSKRVRGDATRKIESGP
ncbi:MAG: hypothetical protein EBS00_00700 [Verrucomicrobia bacterium]|nr:hypothetical protein [Verrucomicrobiota bacterium]